MLKNILKLDGAQQLSEQEQQSINGGHNCINPPFHCPAQYGCVCKSGLCYGLNPHCI